MIEIQVGLAERAYPIIIREGLLAEIGADLKKRAIAKRYVVVGDDHVAGLFGADLLSSMRGAGLDCELITFPRGEANKNLKTVADLASKLARLGVDRKDALVALGGGVTGDITGFLASSYMRGIPFVQVPTTLLAQVDSSVGGKTGVDIPEGKNLVGAFYQPKCVYIDSTVLKSLPDDELLNGLAEVIKYSVIYDADFFTYLEVNRAAILALDLPIMEKVIAKCCKIKAEVVAADERESDLRRILNFGHTLGHAVEAASGYCLAHGMAVAIGMRTVCDIAVGKGIFSEDEAGKVGRLIADYGLPIKVPAEYDRLVVKSYLKTDKKTVGGRPFFVLPTTIGQVVITDDVTEELIDQAIG
ncbi:MAG: 3-dehydroquinate synthase [Proteobacteria bacterium]|nr:3-dehydroquinate synthase [Pseudomonadota bacterium]MBU1717243.1 3-dehydroquinate synthase [Pseudomonadota bacterium]